MLNLLTRGQVGRAVRRLTSNGIANLDEEWVEEGLKAKYTDRGRPMPATVAKGRCLESLPCLKETLLNLQPGIAPGFGGLRGEHLRSLGEVWQDGDIERLENFALAYLNGELRPWFYTIWNSVTTVPLFKTAERDTLRPLGIKPSFLRVVHKEVVTANKATLTTFLEPQQLALTRAGGFILVHGVRIMAEEMRGREGWVVVKLDVANAHNEVSRAAVVEVLESEVELRHLAQHAATCLAGHQGLEAHGDMLRRKGEGLDQGDPEASPWFCVAWHPYVKELDRKLTAAGGKAMFGNDDGYLIGPAQLLFPALDAFSQQISQHCSLRLQLSKTEVFSWEETLPAEVPQGMRRAGCKVGDTWQPGFICYGIAIGTDSFVRHQLSAKVDEITEEVNKVREVLGPNKDSQAIWTILHCSLAQKFDWQLSLNYPSDTAEAAARLDKVLWQLMETAAGFHIPERDEGKGFECVLASPDLPANLRGRSTQSWMVRQPVRLRGLGLRSLLETRDVAFVGGVEMAVPRLTGEGGFCSVLERVLGTVDGAARWRDFLASGTRTAAEFTMSWGCLRVEVGGLANMLGKNLTGPLASPCESAGQKERSSRRAITEMREELRHDAMVKCLDLHEDRAARPVFGFQKPG